jgi:glutamyl-tRNA synthetase
VSHAPASFSYEKLEWLNGVHIRSLSEEDLLARLLPIWQEAGLVPEPCPDGVMGTLRRAVPLVQERLKRLTDVVEWTDFLLQDIQTPPGADLVGRRMTPKASLEALCQVSALLKGLDPFEPEQLEPALRGLAADLEVKAGALFGIVRWAVTGKKVAPPLFGSLAALGRERALARLDAAEVELRGYVTEHEAGQGE